MSTHITDDLSTHCAVMALMVRDGVLFKAFTNQWNQYVIEFTGGY